MLSTFITSSSSYLNIFYFFFSFHFPFFFFHFFFSVFGGGIFVAYFPPRWVSHFQDYFLAIKTSSSTTGQLYTTFLRQ